MEETDGSRLLLAGSDGIFGNDGGAQAQVINVYQSQDNPNQTLWIFRDDGQRPFYGSAIRGPEANNFHRRDSWKIDTNNVHGQGRLYFTNKPTNALFNLTPLLGSTNAIDIDSITKRLPGSPGFGPFSANTVSFDNANVTNAPTMTFGSASKTIGKIFMNLQGIDNEIGVRGIGGGNLLYNTNGASFAWFGSGILNKPISEFRPAITAGGRHVIRETYSRNHISIKPYFSTSGIRIRRHPFIIPEPGNYMLIACMLCVVYVVARSAIAKRK